VDARHATYLQRTPKIELHVHLEGAIRPRRLLSILQRHGDRTYTNPHELEWLFQHESYDAQDVHDVAADLFAEMRAQNIVYAEVLFSAAVLVQQGMPWDELLAAVCESDPGYNIVVDLVRNFGADFAVRQVESLAREAHPRVVGVHLGGDEVGFPARLFETAFRLAREAGLGCAAHAGEADGAASVRDALEILLVQRVGHGIRCLEDDAVVDALLQRGTTLEVCPTGNLRTRVVDDLESHPLPQLVARGLNVTLGADDPSFFDTDLTREMLCAHGHLGCDLETIDAMTDQAARASFCSTDEREATLDAVRRERAALRAELGLPA
jgi:adenosine deaminase